MEYCHAMLVYICSVHVMSYLG